MCHIDDDDDDDDDGFIDRCVGGREWCSAPDKQTIKHIGDNGSRAENTIS